jgi:hypothetical protein
MVEPYINILIAYRNNIEKIIEKDPTHPISLELKKETISVNQFIDSYQTLEKNKKNFDRYTEGLIKSMSPLKSPLFNLDDLENTYLN